MHFLTIALRFWDSVFRCVTLSYIHTLNTFIFHFKPLIYFSDILRPKIAKISIINHLFTKTGGHPGAAGRGQSDNLDCLNF